MRETLHKSTRSQISLCIDFLKIWARQGFYPKFLPKSPYAHQLYTMPSLYVIALYQIKTSHCHGSKGTSTGALANINAGVSPISTLKIGKVQCSRDQISLQTLPIAFLLILSFSGTGIWTCVSLRITTSELKEAKYLFLKSAATSMRSSARRSMSRFTCRTHLSSQSTMNYMCPETGEIREIRLYKCTEFPLRWSFHKTLIKDVSAVDTNIFFFNDRWWLLTNIDSSEIGDLCSELHVFYSDTFDSDTWTPHAKNPVIFDSERARNGGFFRDGEKLLRVFQRQGFDLYGESMGIAQIKDLGMETYREEAVSRIEPRFAPKIVGTHSFSYDNGLLAVDFVKVERVKASR